LIFKNLPKTNYDKTRGTKEKSLTGYNYFIPSKLLNNGPGLELFDEDAKPGDKL
jgi:hypothetical protein